jgi:hypothetical protein
LVLVFVGEASYWRGELNRGHWTPAMAADTIGACSDGSRNGEEFNLTWGSTSQAACTPFRRTISLDVPMVGLETTLGSSIAGLKEMMEEKRKVSSKLRQRR